MISKLAIADLNRMKRDGLSPTFEDVIRLNALGLKVEHSQSSATLYELPRVAFLGKLSFREPTIGHSVWIDSVSRFCDTHDLSTYMAIRAFALSREVSQLPDSADKAKVVKDIDDFTKNELAVFTVKQVGAAISYAIYGADETAKEYPAPPKREEGETDGESDADERDDDLVSIGAGALLETTAMGLGISLREIASLTMTKVKALQELAMAKNGVDLTKGRKSSRLADYYNTLDEVTSRLKGNIEDDGEHPV